MEMRGKDIPAIACYERVISVSHQYREKARQNNEKKEIDQRRKRQMTEKDQKNT